MTINELGVIPAIIRWTGDLKEATTTATTIAVGNSLLLATQRRGRAMVRPDAMDAPDPTWLTRVPCLTIIVDGLIAVPRLAQLARNLRQGAQNSAEIVGMFVMVGVSVGMAAAGAGAASMVWGRVAGSVIAGVIMIACAPFLGWPRFDYGRSRAAPEVRRAHSRLCPLLAELVLNVDYIVVGSVLSVSTLGIYLLAFNLSKLAREHGGHCDRACLVRRVLSTSAHDAARLVTGFLRSIEIAASAVVPLVVLVAVARARDRADRVRVGVAPGRGGGGSSSCSAACGCSPSSRPSDRGRRPPRDHADHPHRLVRGPRAHAGHRRHRGRYRGRGHRPPPRRQSPRRALDGLRAARSGVPPMGLARTLARPGLAGAAAPLVTEVVREALSGDFVRLVVSSLAGGAVYLAVLLPRNAQVVWLVQQLKGDRTADAEHVA